MISFVKVSPVEEQRARDFTARHADCGDYQDFTLRTTVTGLGTKIVIKCECCLTEADVSEYESW